MKFVTILFSVLVGVSALKQDVYKIPSELLSKLLEVAQPCAEEFNVDPLNINKLCGTLPRDEATNKFLHCFARNNGLVDKDGHIVVAQLAVGLKDHPRVEEFKEAMIKCSKISKEDPVATIVAEYMCYCENSPILFEYAQ